MGQSRMRHSKILRQPLPLCFLRILLQKLFEFAGSWSPVSGILRELLPKLDGQVEGVSRCHLRSQLVKVSSNEGPLDAIDPLGKNAGGKDIQGFGAQVVVFFRGCQNFFSSALIKSD